jgi:hypothetical protein
MPARSQAERFAMTYEESLARRLRSLLGNEIAARCQDSATNVALNVCHVLSPLGRPPAQVDLDEGLAAAWLSGFLLAR